MTKDIVKNLVKDRANKGTIYTHSELERVVTSQFRFLKKVMEGGDFSSVRLRYLGVFYVKVNRLQNFNADRAVKRSNIMKYSNGSA